MINFKHSGNVGDFFLSIPTILSLLEQNKQDKANIYLELDQQAYHNTAHPLKNVKLNKNFAEMLIPLLKSQTYVNEIEIYDNQTIDVDLDDFRCLDINQSCGYIARWYFYTFMADFDLSLPWIFIEPNTKYKDQILVNRTFRYRNLSINYKFLNKYDVTFVGMEDEYENFKLDVANAGHIKCENFLEMAQIIAGCKLFIGNQSAAYNLAESIKKQGRILEICPFAANVIPHGRKAWDFYTQAAFETIVKTNLGVK